MPDDQPDAGDLRERVADLEATVAAQEETIQKLMPSRRQAMVGAGLLGGGLLGGRLSTGTARAQAAGQQGTVDEPNDMFAWDLDVQNGATFNGSDLTGVGTLDVDSLLFNSTVGENISAERSVGTWYQNNDERPIFLSITAELDKRSTGEEGIYRPALHVNVSQITNAVARSRIEIDADSLIRTTISYIVGPGEYYRIENADGDPDFDIYTWFETEVGQ